MTRVALRAARLALPLLAVACSAAERPPGEDSLVFIATQVPDGTPRGGREPAQRFPPGTRLVRWDARSAEGPHVLSAGLLAAGGASVHHDGSRILFVGKERDTDPYRIWTCAPDGGSLERAVAGDTDCAGAAFLPDGRIVYSAALPSAVPAPVPGMTRGYVLHVAAGDGNPGAQITFGAGCDLDPFVLGDGRIAYTSWVPDDSDRGGHFALFSVHPDGTGAARLSTLEGAVGEVSAARQQADGTLFCVTGEPAEAGRLHAWDWRAPGEPGGAPFEGQAAAILSAEPGPAGGVLVVPADGSAPRVLGSARPVPPLEALLSEGHGTVHAAAVIARSRPQGHLSMVKPELGAGTLLGIDARPRPDVAGASVVLHAVEGSFDGKARPATRVLGTIPLATDGSFFARVPADTPLLLDVVDGSGNPLEHGRAPFWVRPNENRACIGCHEPMDTAPPNRRPRAVLAAPVDLAVASSGGDR